jgi:type II secretory pathway pseudopilin PulG
VKLIDYNPGKKCGFTIVELLTVMSIIILLIGLLVPALNRVRRYATRVKQKAQFHAMSIALEQFNAEYDGYPDSNARDDQGQPYCGSMKLCEAMVGQDLKGYNPKSRFRYREINLDATTKYYPNPVPATGTPAYENYNIAGRKMYLQLENANAYQLGDIYTTAVLGDTSGDHGFFAYSPDTFVLCDVYNRVTNIKTGKKIGMPILYYRADLTKTMFPGPNDTPQAIRNGLSTSGYIYNVYDNQNLIEKGLPWDTSVTAMHPLSINWSSGTVYPKPFYDMIRNPMIPTGDRPYRQDSYILLSAGFDGLYGTVDDVFNFAVLGE